MSKKKKISIIAIITSFLLVVGIIATVLSINLNKKTKDPKFVYNASYYETDRSAISTSSLSSQYVKMNTLYTHSSSEITRTSVSVDTNKRIAIETAMDFYAFMVLANRKVTTGGVDTYPFLTYEYELLSDINMEDAYEAYPIGYDNKVFTGVFNGNGHVIKNLRLTPVTQANVSNFSNTHYYALFCQNDGTVANFGLVNPRLSIGATVAESENSEGIYYVANVVGKNTRTVSYVFVRDNIEREAKATPGIDLIAQGYHVSGVVAVNAAGATFDNSYYASTTVISSNNNKPAEFQEVLLQNNGTQSNLFFYDSLITNYTSTAVRYGGFLDKTFNYTARYGTYCTSIAELNTALLATNNENQVNTWYTDANYSSIGALSTFFDSIITPLTRGFENGQVAYSDGKYYVSINNANDLSYIYELMDINSKFASNAFVYELTASINLDNVLSPKYNNGIAATFTTKNANDNTPSSQYKTIYLNSLSYKVTTLGIDAYGVFPYLTGTVKYLNFVVGGSTQLEYDEPSDNIIAYGAIAGYVEGGTIESCNVYNNFKIDSKVGKYYVGGAVGILAGEGTVKKVSSNGSITATNTDGTAKTITQPNGYVSGVAVGGVVGYIDSSLGSIDTLYNQAFISSNGYYNNEVVVGGVVGAGYTLSADRLQNNGTITISNSSYTKLYVSGVIGRLLGVGSQISLFTNNGDITVAQLNAPTYVCGVLNADIQTTATISESLFKEKSNFYFYGSAFTNGANISVSGSSSTLMYTNVINVMNNNGFITKLSGLYNLNYKFASPSASLGNQTIDTVNIHSFAPVLVANSENVDYSIDLYTAYNLRNITLSQNNTISSDLLFTGCILGENINYSDVRNEGDISFTVNNGITGNIQIYGVFEEISANQKAKSIFNGGNINFIVKANITGNVYISGICYSNKNHTNSSFYTNGNPLDTTFDKDYRGTLDNVINAGDIKYGLYDILTSNNKTISDAPSVYSVSGNVLVSGVTVLNESSITNTFNLGDILSANGFTSNVRSIAAGISCIQSGSNASIINCANNGEIRNINMSKTGYIYAGGIVGKNDQKIDFSGISASSNNHLQNIAFTINYGLVLAFNGQDNSEMSPTSFNYNNIRSVSAGIMASGLCNVVNVVNYGKVYASQTSAGLIAVCDFGKFKTEVKDTSHVAISNCLTYPDTYAITHTISSVGESKAIYYHEVEALQSSRADSPIYMETPSATDHSYNGTVIAIINFDNSSNAQYVDIRYLVSFSTVVHAFRLQTNIPDISGQTQTMYSANKNQMYLGSALVYSPLSTSSDNLGNVGIFNENFRFRKAISGLLQDGTDYYNTSTYVTDLYLTDFFEFVGFTKVNPTLLEKIGWDTISYAAAATDFVKNLDEVEIVLKSYETQSSSGFEAILDKAFDTETWIPYCDRGVLSSLLGEILNAQDLASLKAITNYLFFTSTNKSSITRSMREEFATTLIAEFENSDKDLRQFLNSIMTSEVIAKIIAGTDYNDEIIQDKIKEYIDTLSASDIQELALKYLEYLESDHYDELFNNTYKNYYSEEKIELLTALLSNLDSDIIVDLATELDLTGDASTSYKLKLALDSLNNSQKTNLYDHFINDLSNNNSSVVSTVQNAISKLLSSYDISSFTETTDTEINTFSTSIDSNSEKVDLWNIIKNDPSVLEYLDNYYQTQDMYVYDANTGIKHTGFIAKATEYRNTYQTNDGPSGHTWSYNNNTGLASLTSVSERRSSNQQNYDGPFERALYRASRDGTVMKTRFIYTPDYLVTDGTIQYTYTYNNNNIPVTPKTYYYGPYLSSTVKSDYHGQLWANTATTGANGVGRNLKLNTNTGTTAQQGYIPFFVSLDQDFVNNKILETEYGKSNVVGVGEAVPYIWNNNSSNGGSSATNRYSNNNSQSQWVCIDILRTQPGNNQFILKKDTTSQNQINPLSGESVNPIVNDFNYDLAGLTNTTQMIDYGLSYLKQNSSTTDSNIVYGYVTASLITGIYQNFSQWGQNGLFITNKVHEGEGVITTQYIDYTIDDLVNLDGILTKGRSQHGASTDEIEIINTVMGHLFATNEGKSVVMTALGNHFANSTDNSQLAINYLTALRSNQTWVNTYLSKIPFITETYSVTTNINGQNTVQAYLQYIYNNLTQSGYQNIIAHSLENKANFKKVLQYLLDKKSGYYSFISSMDDASFYDWFDDVGDYASDTYSLAELNYLINYINENYSNNQLDVIISGVNDSSINAILQATLSNTYDLSQEELEGYTFGDDVTAVLEYNYYDNTNYYSAIRFDDDSTVSFTTGNHLGLQQKVVAYGTGSISIGEETYSLTSTPSVYTFDVDGNENYTMDVSSDTRIIAMSMGYGSSPDVEIIANNPYMEVTGSFSVNTYNPRSDVISGMTLYNIEFADANNYITIYLPNSINNRNVVLKCRRITGTNNINISLINENNVTNNQVISSGDITLTYTGVSGSSFRLIPSITNFNWKMAGISFDGGTTYHYFDNMIKVGDRYYLSTNTKASVTITGTDILYSYVKDSHSTTASASIDGNTVSVTATEAYGSASSSTTIQAITGITEVAVVEGYSSNALYSNFAYDEIIDDIISTGTSNNYFAYTNNALSNLIIRNRYNEAACKYNLEVSELPNGAITNASDKYSFFNVTGTNTYYAQRVNETSTTIVGKTFTSSLQLPNSNQAYISFTAAANSYLYIIAKQNNSSSLTITNNTKTYTIPLNRSDSVYAINIKDAGTYSIYSTGTSNIYDIYYATGSTTNIGSVYNNTALKGAYIKGIFTNYDNFHKYYVRNNLFESSTNITANSRKFKEIVYLLYGTTYSDMDLYNKLTDAQIENIIKYLFKYQDTFLRNAITDSTTNYITTDELINEISIVCGVDSAFLIDVFNQANISMDNITDQSNHYYSWVYRLVAAYISTNYLMNYNELNMADSTLTETDLYTILSEIDGHMYTVDGQSYTFTSSCQFIGSDTTINSVAFEKLMTALGHDLSSTGYGIYALSSSHGKLNGEFIPDNLSLDSMDPQYTLTGSIYTLTTGDATDAKWRGGTSLDEDDVSDTTSVNYAFYEEMKQLTKSISTTVFELTLTKDDYEYYGDIDLDTGVITFYVPSLSTGSYTVSNIDLAYRAIAHDGELSSFNPSGTVFETDSTITVSSLNTVSKKFTVFAEDRTVKKVYSIVFKELSTTLTMTYSNGTNTMTVAASSNDTTVVLAIGSSNDKLPLGFDLKPYLSVTNGSETYSMDSEYISISTLSTDHKVLQDGSAVATIVISYKLPADTYSINLDICGAHAEVEYIKQASNQCNIESMRFNGSAVTFTGTNATSDIKFGRAYNNIELTDIDGLYSDYYDFYLDSLVISANASVKATVTKSLTLKSYRFGDTEYRLTSDETFKQGKTYYTLAEGVYSVASVTVGQSVTANTYYEDISVVNYYITSYVVSYVVTAENGTTKKTYKHILTELDPFDSTNSNYGDIYRDGIALNTVNTLFDEDTVDGTKNQTVVSFERGNEKYYRLKYNFNNIYTLDDNIEYGILETTIPSLSGKATFNIEYRGISIDVNEYCDAGEYSFLFTYKNKQEWGLTPHLTDGLFDGTFTKSADTYIEYTFPRLVVRKTYSTDATLHSIVLIDAYRSISAASTVMDVNNLRPVEGTQEKPLASGERYYQTLMNATDQNPNDIEVGDVIDYQHRSTDYSVASYTDYYVVGTVSNAQLNNYAPSFTIDDYGMIFQSTTLQKIKKYGKGDGKQGTLTDAQVLGDHTSQDGSVLFLYVPFTYIDPEDSSNTLTKIFLVKFEGKTLTNVYDDRYDGTGDSVATMPANVTLDYIRGLKLDSESSMPTIVVSGVTYTLSRSIGNISNNQSLYMDYIGNPLDDHFWYVTYVIFSEDYIRSSSNTHIKFFHVSLIDVSNNVYFSITVVTPNDEIFADIQQMYITVVGYEKVHHDDSSITFEEIAVGAYVNRSVVDNVNNTITYELIYSLQIMPSAYYYFNIDLPGGYVATAVVTDPNKEFNAELSNDYLAEAGVGSIEDYEGAYLPPSSLVVQRVPLTINVSKGTTSDSSAWAIATSDTYTRQAVLVLLSED